MDVVEKFINTKVEDLENFWEKYENDDNFNLCYDVWNAINYHLATTPHQKILNEKLYTLISRVDIKDYKSILKIDKSSFELYDLERCILPDQPMEIFTFIVNNYKNKEIDHFNLCNFTPEQQKYIKDNIKFKNQDYDQFLDAINEQNIELINKLQTPELLEKILIYYVYNNDFTLKFDHKLEFLIENKILIFNFNIKHDNKYLIDLVNEYKVKLFVRNGADPSLSNRPLCIYLNEILHGRIIPVRRLLNDKPEISLYHFSPDSWSDNIILIEDFDKKSCPNIVNFVLYLNK